MSNLKESILITICGIQHFSLFNGKGIRTTIFFKGCPLRCSWCCNPETQENKIHVALDNIRCIGPSQCGLCITTCPHGAIYPVDAHNMGFARDLCQNCRLCTAVCPSKALFVDGETLDIEEIMRRVLLDADIIREGGGVTLSGGEPFMRPQAAAALLSRCHEIKLHTAVETCGFFDLDDNYLRTALGDTDVLYYDIKQMDCVKHKQGTDLDNERILHNLKRIGLEFPDLTVVTRTAIIPGFNDTVQDFLAIAHFVKSVKNVQRHEILNFNTYCSEKYIQMGLPVPISLSYKTNMNLIQECVKIGENVGLQVEVLL